MTNAMAVTEVVAGVNDDELQVAVREHSRLLYRICYSVLRHPQDAEDAVQETFLRLWRQKKRWRDIGEPRGWLARVAWRVAIDRRRPKAEVSLEVAAQAVDAGAAGTLQLAADRQMMRLVEGLIAGLPAPLRDALTLSTIEEMTAAEVAAVLGIPEATVRTRVFRARQMLREKLSVLLERKWKDEGKHDR